MKEKRLKGMLHCLPMDDRVSFDMAEMQQHFANDQRSMCLQIMQDIVGLPTGLMIGTGRCGTTVCHCIESVTSTNLD